MGERVPASEPNIVRAEELAVIAVRGALKDAYQHGYREGMKRGQEMAAWGYMTADGIAASRKRLDQKARRREAHDEKRRPTDGMTEDEREAWYGGVGYPDG